MASKAAKESDARALISSIEAPVNGIGLYTQESNLRKEQGKSQLSAIVFANEEFERRAQILESSVSMDAVLARSYWTRLWICQELVLARGITIFCGKDFCNGFDLQYVVLAYFAPGRTCPVPAIITQFCDSTGTSFALAISLFASGKCEDPRDKMFGLAAIANDYETHRLFCLRC